MTLTETAYWARRGIKYGSILLVVLILSRFAFMGVHWAYRSVFPKPPPPPEVKFQKLPSIVFDARFGPNGLSYTLELPKRDLPTFPTQVNVFFMPTPQASIANLTESKKMAQLLGFAPEDSKALSDVIYRFTNLNAPATLDINIVNKTLSLSYNLAEDPGLLSLRPRFDSDVINTARAFLTRANLYSEDLEKGGQEVEYLASGTEALTRVGSLSEANFVRVNFLRRDYEGLKVITPRNDRSTVWLLVSGETSGPRQVIAGEYHYFPIDEGQKSTYPIKSSMMAFEELKAGKAFIIAAPATGTTAIIRRVYLAYFDSGKPQQFLQPVVVFDGGDDSGFRAIVPAVTSEYYGR